MQSAGFATAILRLLTSSSNEKVVFSYILAFACIKSMQSLAIFARFAPPLLLKQIRKERRR